MNKFKQLSLEQRYQIDALLKAGTTKTAIAVIVGVHKSTICRELQRNTPKRGKGAKEYNPTNAWRKTCVRHQVKAKRTRFTQKMKDLIVAWMIKERLTPELIYAKAIKQGIDMVSHETIYSWIWEMKHSNKKKQKPYKTLYWYLKHGKRHRKRGHTRDKRGQIPLRRFIEERPAIVAKRKRIGDVEIDLMMGKDHQSALLVMTDRATIKTKLRKVKSKNSALIAAKAIQALQKEKPFIKTLTFDNDMAFAHHLKIAKKLNAQSYFTHPYSSQEKGTVENRIGVIRMFYPKKTDFNLISHHEIKRVENSINNRPVRKFNYLTPNQLYNQKLKVAFIG